MIISLEREKRSQAKFESELKLNTDDHVDEKIVDSFDRTMKQLESLQSSALKIPERSMSIEHKSL